MTTDIIATGGVPAKGFDLAEMKAIMNTPQEVFDKGLEGANLITVINAYGTWLNKQHKKNNTECVRTHIEYLQITMGMIVMPSMCNALFIVQLANYLREQKVEGTDRFLAESTVVNYIGVLYAALKWSRQYGANVPENYCDVKFEKPQADTRSMTLTTLMKIYHYDLDAVKMRKDHREVLKRVRDTFVIQSMLGMRYSDMERLNESWFQERGHIKFLQQKTKNETDINVERVCFETKTLAHLLTK